MLVLGYSSERTRVSLMWYTRYLPYIHVPTYLQSSTQVSSLYPPVNRVSYIPQLETLPHARLGFRVAAGYLSRKQT
jgi:hypothetical protein